MTRLIIQEAHSGFLWADSALFQPAHCADYSAGGFDPSGPCCDANILAAIRTMQWEIGDLDQQWEIVSRRDARILAGRDGYIVWRADVDGSDAVAAIQDGQDMDTIRAVERGCELVAVVAKCDGQEAQ